MAVKFLEPDFMKDFACRAGACKDTCCAGWEIEIDEESAKTYRNVSGKIGERLRASMKEEEDGTFFTLTEDKRCPFLNSSNLCDLITELGEDALCEICTEHPRFYNFFDEFYAERGLGLCCEEAVRLFFENKDPLNFRLVEEDSFTEEEVSETGADGDSSWMTDFLRMREQLFEILQDRSETLADRLHEAHAFLCTVDGSDSSAVTAHAVKDPEMAAEILSFYETLECMNPSWREMLAHAKGNLSDIFERGFTKIAEMTDRAYEWEHLSVYFLYRYLGDSLEDGKFLLRMDFTVLSLFVIGVLAADVACMDRYTEEQRDEIVRLYSKEIEYCPENMKAIFTLLDQDSQKDFF